jgi:hypothetical protein
MINTRPLDRAPRLVRRFLATGETRCPLLCLWTLEATSSATEDPERTWPARWTGLLDWTFRRAASALVRCLKYDSRIVVFS